jgi:hypothetical protein
LELVGHGSTAVGTPHEAAARPTGVTDDQGNAARGHRAVLADIVRIADTENVDVVLITGDLYEDRGADSRR